MSKNKPAVTTLLHRLSVIWFSLNLLYLALHLFTMATGNDLLARLSKKSAYISQGDGYEIPVNVLITTPPDTLLTYTRLAPDPRPLPDTINAENMWRFQDSNTFSLNKNEVLSKAN